MYDFTFSPWPETRRKGRAWIFGGIFALLLIAAWIDDPAQAQEVQPQQTVPPAGQVYLPLLHTPGTPSVEGCPAESTYQYDAVPILGAPRPVLPEPVDDPDLNLAMRGWVETQGVKGLIALGGDTHDDAPQLAHLFQPPRLPTFVTLHQIYDWNWSGVCAQSAEEPGCRGVPLTDPPVTLVGLETTPGELLYLPSRQHDILNGVYRALVLYAEPTRLTLTYTRDDSIVHGYVVHLENLCVDPNLLALYHQLHEAGRHQLPGLRLDVPLGTSREASVLLAIRDEGSFMDPRSRKDWWKGYERE